MIILMIKLWVKASIMCMRLLIYASYYTIIFLFNFFILCMEVIASLLGIKTCVNRKYGRLGGEIYEFERHRIFK